MAHICLKVIIFCINILTIYAKSTAFGEVLDKTDSCKDKCTKSFAPHTYPNGGDNEACMRGCRLYTITKFVAGDESEDETDDVDDGLTPAKRLCHDSCVESYNETSPSGSACKMGCNIEELIFEEKEEQPEEEGGIHLLKPVMQVREVAMGVIGMLRIIQSTITTYFISDDNKMVAVEGPVQVLVEVIPDEEDKKPEEEEEDQAQALTLKRKQSQLEEDDDFMSSSVSSIECLSRRVGVPPYLIIVSLLSFIIFLTYLLFVICTSNSKKKAKSMMSIPAHALPVKLVRPEDLTKLSLMDEEESQAPPLPSKVQLPDIHA